MTDYLRKDADVVSEQPELLDRISTEPVNNEELVDDKLAPRASVTPPPAEARPVSITSHSGTGAAVARAPEEEKAALFMPNECNELRSGWDSIQVGFVDEPRNAVQEADALVSATMKRLAEIFAAERQKLEGQWGRSENISTEDLRVALRRYRSFFARLLAI
jgi:hypothetical protein